MKVIVKDELRTRLICAAYNGSVIARDILAQLKENKDQSEIIRGKANYFATKRKKQATGDGYTKVKIVFTCCNKDTTNENFPDRNNPQAPWFTENRTEVEPSTFVDCFKNLGGYSGEDMEYFANSICVMSKLSVKLYGAMSDFEEAYNYDNYYPLAQFGECTLHNSCMRHELTARNAADFYYNFAGAKILVAKDAENNILGRAIVWLKARHEYKGEIFELSLIDRVYYTHSFVMKLIWRYAESIGIHLRKTYNDYSHTQSFQVMNVPERYDFSKGEDIENTKLAVYVPSSKWHKSGAPYLDTFLYISLNKDGNLQLSNYESNYNIAMCRSTTGYADRFRWYCPNCGKLHKNSDPLCDECKSKLLHDTFVGRVLVGKTTTYQKQTVPVSFIRKVKPTPTYALYLQIQKLYKY